MTPGLPFEVHHQRFSYADYYAWDDGLRWELIDGEAYDMSPAPSRRHQRISGELHGSFFAYLKGKPCQVYSAPFDVRLPRDGKTDDRDIVDVVQPDLVVVCDRAKLDDRGCLGAPDLVIEILSPHTAKKDMNEKYDLYERAGVLEYWIVQPELTIVNVYRLDGGRYARAGVFGSDDKIGSTHFPDLEISHAEVFGERKTFPPSPPPAALREEPVRESTPPAQP